MTSMQKALPVVVTMGEPAGIGGEIAIKSWMRLHASGPAFFLIDDGQRLNRLSRELGVNVETVPISHPSEAAQAFHRGLPVLETVGRVEAEPGRPCAANAAAVLNSIMQAVSLVQTGQATSICTNPIQKSILTSAGFRFPGHTEYLAHLAQVRRPVMMLVGGGLRVVPITIHVPLRAVADLLTVELVVDTARIVARALTSQFGMARPRLALAGLNPHAGENGTIGLEDRDILEPAVAALREMDIDITGPHPADTMFHPVARAKYDVALCPTHDQALIPLKTIAFDDGVNVTLGLPFVRTSPDHGTALDITGQGKANPTSLIAAIRMAADLGSRVDRSSSS